MHSMDELLSSSMETFGLEIARFPDDFVARFDADSPRLYGDVLRVTFANRNEELISYVETVELETREQTSNSNGSVEARSSAAGTDGVSVNISMVITMTNEAIAFPCWERNMPISRPIPSLGEYKASFETWAASRQPRSLCAKSDCNCKAGWKSPETDPIWALRIGAYQINSWRGSKRLLSLLLGLARVAVQP